jgi:cytochrome c-type biogenesis protein CcmH/NrfF
LRDDIKRQLAAGQTRESIVDGLVAQFGERIRGVPRFAGAGLLAWLGPIVTGAVVLVALMLSVSVRRSRPSAHEAVEAVGWEDASLCRRLDDELARLD